MIFDPEDEQGAHLDDDGSGGDVVAIQGIARIDPDQPAVSDNAPYLAKDGPRIDSGLGGPARMAEPSSVPIAITPTRGTAFLGQRPDVC